MLAKLIVEGNEFDIEILDPKLQELLAPPKKTGYELERNEKWYHELTSGEIAGVYPSSTIDPYSFYEMANYYSDKTVAENNARADKLMRQLRRFAVEHRDNNLDWKNEKQRKWCIHYDHNIPCIAVFYYNSRQNLFIPFFDSKEAAELAIETFRDELIWYFTEYKDSL